MSPVLTLISKLSIVVDLAVDDGCAPPVLGEERLSATRHVDDREPGMDEKGGA